MVTVAPDPHAFDQALEVDAVPTREGSGSGGSSASSRFYLPALDGIRSIAFLLTFWVHAGRPIVQEATGFAVRLDALLLQIGQYGVPLFFTMSAFLVTRLLLLERERTGAVDVRAFLIRRTIRIWPLYFLLLFVASVLIRMTSWLHPATTTSGVEFGYALFMGDLVHGFVGTAGYSVLWSLGVEEKFYLIWPWFVRGLTLERLRRVGWGLVIVGIASAFLLAPFGNPDLVSKLPIPNAAAFGYGILMACGALRAPRFLADRARGVWTIAALLAGLILAVLVGNRAGQFGRAAEFVIGTTVVAAYFAVAKEASSGLLTWRPMVELGKRSYGAYLYHYALTLLAANLVTDHRGPAYFVVSLLALASTIAIAFASYRFLETPLLRLKARFERVPSRPI